ncbi:Palmitoyltransferase AKR1 [Nakaseomyces bracarensis]|uniref:Palmitoyltransferase n=1 Tax=Nakaseomyces bracarensis TaxID=273131 RepID=A0ABR4NNV5_9SACH
MSDTSGPMPDDSASDANSQSSLRPIVSNAVGNEEYSEEETDPVLSRYHNACQRGDLEVVKEMIHNGLIDVTNDADPEEKVTGLHWASINNRLNVVEFLVSKGALIDSKAGALEATPLHWAARYGFVYVVDFLLQHGASPTQEDNQGFNLLHLAVNSSNIMLVVYVLFFVVGKGIIDVNCVDPKGRTPLLWAAYQGDSLTVAELLKFGASVKIADEGGFTPLHWGTVKGQPHVLKYLIQDGADFFQKTNDGKDCFKISEEMATTYSFQEALQQNRFDKNGYPLKKLFKKDDHAKLVTFFIPLIVLGLAFLLGSKINILVALPIMMVFGLAVNKFLQKYVLPSYESKGIHTVTLIRSPIIAGILFGSIFWLAFVWVFNVMPYTISKRFFGNVTFFILLSTVLLLLFKLIFSDPGCITADQDQERIRGTITELLQEGRFDTRDFCLETWQRKPLRSKYSFLNNALVLRFDHYCPWIYNDVGLKNHKQFIYFILALELGIASFTKICLKYFDKLDMEDHCFLLGDDDLCSGYIGDRFTFLILCWCCLQGVWIFSLIGVQLFQITKGITNSELNALIREGRRSEFDTPMHNEFFNTVPESFNSKNNDRNEVHERSNQNAGGNGTNERISTAFSGNIPRPRTCMGLICAVTGLHQCLAIVKDTLGLARHKSGSSAGTRALLSSISTDYGWRTNWKDFWLVSDAQAPMWQRIFYAPHSTKALLNGKEVDYSTLYEVPTRDHGNVSVIQEQDPLAELDDLV